MSSDRSTATTTSATTGIKSKTDPEALLNDLSPMVKSEVLNKYPELV